MLANITSLQASFLLMQCAERMPSRMKHLVEEDLIR